MPESNTKERFSSARWLELTIIAAGWIVIALGLTVIMSWYAHWSRLLQVFPSAPPVQYNTALCFVLSGAGLVVLNTRFAGTAIWPGGFVALFTSLTLLEYLIGRNFGIDQLLFRPYLQVATAFPGRMAPLTAFCFMLFGATLGLASAGHIPKRTAAAGLLATVVAMVGMIALLGYLTGMKMAYGWGAYSLMAIHTASAFFVLGVGLVLWCWRKAAQQERNFVQWIPIAASATLLVMMGVISTATVSSFRTALEWRRHTYEVLLAAQGLQASITDLQGEIWGYVSIEKLDSRPPYDRVTSAAQRQRAELIGLTRDNPGQQLRLQELTDDLSNVFSAAGRGLSVREQDTVKKNPPGEGERAMEHARTVMHAFIVEEQRLLLERSAVADREFKSTVRLLGFSGALAAVFFVAGSLLVLREIQRRNRVEIELNKTAEKLNTLNGLLPICAHCKSIRDDNGYWNRIEAYIQDRSEATFSHGLCENCVKELYPAIADRVLLKMREDASKST